MANWSLREWKQGVGLKPEVVTRGYYFAKISRLAMSQFAYDVKDLKNPELIEKYLWEEGRCAIWYNDYLGWVVTRVAEVGFDINGFAVRWRPIFDIQPEGIPVPPELGVDDKIVVIYDLPTRDITSNMCCMWINEIADTNETIKMQVFNQKTPLVAVGKNPKEIGKLKNAIVDIANNVKALVLDTDFKQNVSALNIESPFHISDLQAHLKTKEAEMLEYLGIDSQSAFQKKERLISDEQESNNQILSYLINDRWESRLKGVEKLREKGLDINVRLTQTFNPNNGGEEDGENESAEPDSR